MQDQSQWEVYQENNEIEQIWYSSRKISDKMQVRDKQWTWIHIEWEQTVRWAWWGSTPEQFTTITMTTYGITDYKEYNWEIRIPFYWTYHLQWTMSWWISSTTNKIWIENNWKNIFELYVNDNVNDVTVDTLLNLWKYDRLKFRTVTTSYSWGSYWITTSSRFKLNLTKI